MRVLVTRPEPGAGKTAGRLAAMGHDGVVLPLSRIRRVQPAENSTAGPFDALAVSSANAIRNASTALLSRLRTLPCNVVGEATAEAARTAGLRIGIVAGGATELAHALADCYGPGTRIAYLCGRVRLGDLEAVLRQAGIVTTPLTTYDTEKISYSTDVVLDRFSGRPVEAVFLFSLRSAEAFLDLAEREPLRKYIAGSDLYCISERVATLFARRWKGRVLVASTPTESDLLELLDTNR